MSLPIIIDLGTFVRWRSQSAGIWKEKVGRVVAVVSPKEGPNDALQRMGIRGKVFNPGMARDHASYVVRVDGRLYWPRVTALEML